MTPTHPKIIFFDIDDTLFIKTQNCLAPNTKTALLALKNQGIIPAIATGRGRCVFPPCINGLIDEIGIELFITINGQYNEYQGKLLSHFPLNHQQIHRTTAHLHTKRIAYGYMTANEIIGFDETPAMTEALTSLHIPYRIDKVENFDKNMPVYQLLAFYDDNKNASVDLGHHLSDDLKSTRWHRLGVDILDKHGSKARGIQMTLDKLGLDMANAWAFGDGLNDIEMLSSVGFGVAMGNAHPNLKTVADFVCPNHSDDGIYQALVMLGVI